MKAYVICVVSTLLLDLLAEYLLKKNKKKYGCTVLVISMLVLCIIAGVRDITVGTDVRGYVMRLATVAQEKDFITYMLNPNSHALFGIIVYIGYLFRDMNFLLFFIEVAVCLPVYIYAYKERNNSSLALILSTFVMTMYCTSYNLIRQSIAISILILAYQCFKNEEKKKAYILVVIASLIHITSFAFCAVFVMYNIVKKRSEKKYAYILGIFAIISLLSFFSEQIIGVTSFDYYIDNVNYMREWSIGSILKQLFWVAIAIFTFLNVKNKKSCGKCVVDSELSIYLFVFSLMLILMSFSIPGMGRLGYYFYDLAIIITTPNLLRIAKPKWMMFVLLTILLFYLWWHMTCVPNDSAGVYPYKSNLVHFLN